MRIFQASVSYSTPRFPNINTNSVLYLIHVNIPRGAKTLVTKSVNNDINQDHFMNVVRDPCSHTLKQEEVGARFAQVSFRTFVNDTDPDDIKAASAVQDQIKVSGVDTIISL